MRACVCSCTLQAGEFHWGNELQGYILGAFFYGYVSTQILGGRSTERYGTKWLFAGSILSTAVLSLFTPVVAKWSLYALIALRIAEGTGEVNVKRMNAYMAYCGSEILVWQAHMSLSNKAHVGHFTFHVNKPQLISTSLTKIITEKQL